MFHNRVWNLFRTKQLAAFSSHLLEIAKLLTEYIMHKGSIPKADATQSKDSCFLDLIVVGIGF